MADERDEIRRSGPDRQIDAEEARQGEVVLRRTWQKGLFLIGLFAGALIAVALVACAAFA